MLPFRRALSFFLIMSFLWIPIACAEELSVVEVSDYASFYKQLNGSFDVISLADNFPTDAPDDFAIRNLKRKADLVIEGNGRMAENLFIMLAANIKLTIRNLKIQSTITEHPKLADYALDFSAVIETRGGSLVMEDVTVAFAEWIGSAHSQIDAVLVGAGSSAVIDGCTLSGASRSEGSGGNGLSCLGEAVLRNSTLHGGDVAGEPTDRVRRGVGLYLAGEAKVEAEGIRVSAQGSAIAVDAGELTLSRATIAARDGISPAVVSSMGGRISFLGAEHDVSWPMFEGDGVGIAGVANRISLPIEEASIEEGEELILTALCEPEGHFASIRWSTADESIATVTGGQILACAAGETEITAELHNGSKAAVRIIVTAYDPGEKDKRPPDDEDGDDEEGKWKSEKLEDVILYEYAQTYPWLKPPVKRLEALTDVYFHEFIKDTPIFSTRRTAGKPDGFGAAGDFAVVANLEGEWAEILWEGGRGYVPYDALYRFRCTMENTPVSAVFIKRQEVYEKPGGKPLATIEADTLTRSVATRGGWTALWHEGELVYSRAEGLALLILEPEYAFAKEGGTAMRLEPDFDADAVTALAKGARLETLSADSAASTDGWILVRVGGFTGYIHIDELSFTEDIDD